MIFNSKAMKELFLSIIKKAKAKYVFKMENFCIMGNHFHFIIQPGKNMSLSKIMQWILSVFAMTFNRTMDYVGHVWGERFFSRILDSLNEYVQAFKYIDQNPVKINSFYRFQKWEYSGLYHHYIGRHDIVDKMELTILYFFPEHTIPVLLG